MQILELKNCSAWKGGEWNFEVEDKKGHYGADTKKSVFCTGKGNRKGRC